MGQVELFGNAKQVFRSQGIEVSDKDCGELCGLKPHVLLAWDGEHGGGVDRMTIRNARREVAAEKPETIDHGGGSGWEPRL